MIDATLIELEPELGIKRACGLLGRSRATRYRKLKPPLGRTVQPRASPPNALTVAERKTGLGVLRAQEHCDLAVAQVWVRELDAGRYYCSIPSMYRILRAEGEVKERRCQATHPAKVKPELVAHGPNQVWSWDIKCRRRHLMSQLHTSAGLVAISSGRIRMGWVAWFRRSPACPIRRSSRCIVLIEAR